MRLIGTLIAVAVVASVCMTAQATISLPAGLTVAKIADSSSLYTSDPNRYSPNTVRTGQTQQPVPWAGQFVPTVPGDDNRTIFNVSTIPDTPPFNFVSGSPDQLKGMLYDLTPISAATTPGSQTIYFTGLNRNPIVGAPAGTGGVLEIWLDPNTQHLYSRTASDALGAGPLAWDEKDSLGNIAGTLGHAIGPDTFPTINQEGEILWLQCVLIPLPGSEDPNASGVPANAVLSETVNVGTSQKGVGKAWAMIVGGAAASLFEHGGLNANYASSDLVHGLPPPAGLSADLSLLFNMDPNPPGGTGGWGVESQDPVTAVVIPEPLTMLGLCMGLGAVGRYVRRRFVL